VRSRLGATITVVVALLLAGCGSDSSTDTLAPAPAGSAAGASPTDSSSADDDSGTGRETWAGETLDGETVVVVEGAGGPRFVDGRPSPLTLIDEAAASGGCDGVQLELNYWGAQASPTEDGRRASAFAKYAQDKRADLGC
jgi:hypothetical protein